METITGTFRIERLATKGSLEDAAQVFREAFNAGDLDGLVSLFEPEAVLVPGPGQVATGADAIREALAGFLAAWERFEVKVLSRHQVGKYWTADCRMEG